MTFAQQQPKYQTIIWFRDHVSSGKAASFAQYGMEFVPGWREGVYIGDVNGDQRVLQFLPPLIVSDPEAEKTLAALDRAMAAPSQLRGWRINH